MATPRSVKPGKSSRMASFTAGSVTGKATVKPTAASFGARKHAGGSHHVKPPAGVKESQRRPRKRLKGT